MAELVAIEPALFREDEAWFVFSDGRRYLRKKEVAARPRRRAPMIISDSIPPTRGPDGRIHESLSSYRASLRPDGNPQGERYLELGDQELPKFQAPEFDPKARREAIKRGIEDVNNGRVPPVVTGDLP